MITTAKFKEISDNTKVYTYKEFCKLFDHADSDEKEQLLIRDIFHILLFSKQNKPIYGRTMLIKQLFLLYNEVFTKYNNIKLQEPNFIPYDFGPYSFKSMKILDDLRFSKEISVDGKRNTKKESFCLTDKGMKFANETFKTLPSELQKEIELKRIGWDQLGTRGILKYVYERYPDMKQNSKIKKRYKDIKWGIGKA
jgi:hypothetical protein